MQKLKVTTADLKRGMYVSQLDRSWLETPFQSHGFQVSDESDLEHFEEAYYGEHKSEADFAEDFTNDCFDYEAPSFVVIDWQATWDRGLSYDFDYEDGFVFNKNW